MEKALLPAGPTMEVVVCVVVFFVGMLLHEVCIEGLWERYEHLPKAIALYITCFQFLTLTLCSKAVVLRNRPAKAEETDHGAEQPSKGETQTPEPPAEGSKPAWRIWLPYVGLSLLVFLSTALSNHSVHYVEYPLKVREQRLVCVPSPRCANSAAAHAVAGLLVSRVSRVMRQQLIASLSGVRVFEITHALWVGVD
jgi:hypothetical protein